MKNFIRRKKKNNSLKNFDDENNSLIGKNTSNAKIDDMIRYLTNIILLRKIASR